MKIVKTVEELKGELDVYRKKNMTIGFVPTMGALHQGHLSLVSEASKQTDVVVTSIFVNPNQFNNSDDLKRYPRDLSKDAILLQSVKCELIFAPNVDEVYPEEDKRKFDFGSLETVMEGKYRPGHFNGVAQVVSRLFDIVQPEKAFFGLKDFQQLAIIQNMVQQLNINVEIVPCSIIREDDGLAMSSRNTLLSDEQRKNAPLIARTLFDSCNFVPELTVEAVKEKVIAQINTSPELELEYFEIVDGYTLQAVDNWADSTYIVGCIAVFANKIRLIDNVIYKNKDHAY